MEKSCEPKTKDDQSTAVPGEDSPRLMVMQVLRQVSMGCMKIVITLRKVPLEYAEGVSRKL